MLHIYFEEKVHHCRMYVSNWSEMIKYEAYETEKKDFKALSWKKLYNVGFFSGIIIIIIIIYFA